MLPVDPLKPAPEVDTQAAKALGRTDGHGLQPIKTWLERHLQES